MYYFIREKQQKERMHRSESTEEPPEEVELSVEMMKEAREKLKQKSKLVAAVDPGRNVSHYSSIVSSILS